MALRQSLTWLSFLPETNQGKQSFTSAEFASVHCRPWDQNARDQNERGPNHSRWFHVNICSQWQRKNRITCLLQPTGLKREAINNCSHEEKVTNQTLPFISNLGCIHVAYRHLTIFCQTLNVADLRASAKLHYTSVHPVFSSCQTGFQWFINLQVIKFCK